MKEIFQEVEMELIDRPEELARVEVEQAEIQSLADSIRERDLLQPIKVVRREGRFGIVFGDRRFLACKLLERKTIMAAVVDATDEEIAIDRAIENLQRVGLTPWEEALQYRAIIEKTGMLAAEVGRKLGKAKSTVHRRLEMLKMPQHFIDAIHSDKVNLTVAEEIFDCGDPAHRDYLLEMAVEHGVKANIARMWVQDWRKSERSKSGVETGGGGEEALPLHKTSYIACGLCDEAVDVTKVKSITVCQECLDQLYDMLHKSEHQKEGG